MKDSIYEFDGKALSKNCPLISFQHVLVIITVNGMRLLGKAKIN